jgi:hypothetical protein
LRVLVANDCFVLTSAGIAGISRFTWVSLECSVTELWPRRSPRGTGVTLVKKAVAEWTRRAVTSLPLTYSQTESPS